MFSVFIFSILFTSVFASVEFLEMSKLVGGVTIIEDEAKHNEVVDLLKQHIGKLESGNWEIVEINKTGQQVVAGIKYFLYGTLKDNSDGSKYAATITIYSRPWEDYIEVNIHDKQQVE